MENINTGDIIKFVGDEVGEKTVIREEVVGRVGKVVFTRTLLESGAVSSMNPPQLIEDLVTYGWTRETQVQRELTIGESMVGLDFNPSNNVDVQWVKETCAKLIDRVELSKGEKPSYVRNMIAGQAQRAVLVAQMLIVKAITLPEGR